MNTELEKALKIHELCLDILETIDLIRDKLNTAKGWGVFDIIGGGLIASIPKRIKMSDARQDILYLQSQLRELRSFFDTNTSYLRTDLDLEMNDMDGFLDIIFDNIFTNISVQTRIKDTLNELDNVKEKISNLLTALEDRYTFTSED